MSLKVRLKKFISLLPKIFFSYMVSKLVEHTERSTKFLVWYDDYLTRIQKELESL